MKKYLLILLIAASCDEDLSPKCQELKNACDSYLRQMDQAKDQKQKEQLRQYYLSEKHELDNCR